MTGAKKDEERGGDWLGKVKRSKEHVRRIDNYPASDPVGVRIDGKEDAKRAERKTKVFDLADVLVMRMTKSMPRRKDSDAMFR